MLGYAVVDRFARSTAVLAIAWMSVPGVAVKSPTPTPYPVSLTLEDARRSVRERMGAAPGLRVGGAAYITGRDLFERWPYRPGVANAGLTYLDAIHSFDSRSTEPPAAPLADVVVVVEGSIAPRPRSVPADDWHRVATSFVLTTSLGCARFDGTPRAPFHAVLDARTGQWLGASWLEVAWQTCLLRDLTTATLPHITLATPLPTTAASAPTATPRRPQSWPWPADGPTPRPPDLPDYAWQPRPLARGQVPAALAKIAADVPVAAGARWRYEWSSMTNYTFYERQDVVTETIDAAWQIGPDVMVSHVSTSPGMRVMWGRDGVWLYTFPNGFATNLQVHRGLGPDHKPSLSIMRRWLDKIAIEDGQEASEMAANALNEGVDTLAIDALPWPPSVWHYATWAWHWSGDADVRVPAGRFRGCHGLDVAWGSNSGRAYDWFCSGIGLVRHDYHDYGMGYGDNAMELVAYDIPPLVARDAPPLPTTTATPTKTPAAPVARRTISLIRQ
ncbi:MAG: hypothetical protein IPG72_02385 [Ardenticatenales bacterium]|nr:hypothetical protein [Ardenticatenales bacterium]